MSSRRYSKKFNINAVRTYLKSEKTIPCDEKFRC